MSVLDRSLPQPQLRFRTAKAEYERWVEETKRHIVDGDVFQTVISQRLDLIRRLTRSTCTVCCARSTPVRTCIS